MEPGYQKELPREVRGKSQAFSSDSAKKGFDLWPSGAGAIWLLKYFLISPCLGQNIF